MTCFFNIPDGVAQAQDKTFTNSIDLEFVLIPAGKFTSTWRAVNDSGEDVQKQRVVTISKPFYLGKYEVTQEQWRALMGENPSHFKGRTKPVENVSWHDAQIFIKKLNKKEGGNKYRLPTDAEWEHAARAGTDTEYFFGDDPAALRDYAWFDGHSEFKPHPVGKKKHNPWGLYDVYGNVWEWVQDWWADEYQEGAVTDPTGPASGSRRVSRGGSWLTDAMYCRSASRGWLNRGCRAICIGFRLAFSPDK